MALNGSRSHWTLLALCDGLNVNAFFADGRGSKSGLTVQARRVCLECPVRQECLAEGWDEEHGIWGGTIPEDRLRIKKGLQEGTVTVESYLAHSDQKILREYKRHYGWELQELLVRLQDISHLKGKLIAIS